MSEHDCFKHVSLINLVYLLTIFIITSQKYLKVKSKLVAHESNCKLYTSSQSHINLMECPLPCSHAACLIDCKLCKPLGLVAVHCLTV